MGQYDLTQKNLEYYQDVFADTVNALLYKGKQVIQPCNLYPAPTETLYRSKENRLRNQFHDVSKYEMHQIKSDDIQGRKKSGDYQCHDEKQSLEIKVQYTLENETCCNRKIVLRKAGYEGAVYREQYDGKIHETYPVIGAVLYWGKKKWSASKSMRRFLGKKDIPKEAIQYIDDIRVQVFDMRRLPQAVRSRFHSDMRIVVDYLAEGKDYVPTNQPIQHVEALLRLLSALSADDRYERILKQVQDEAIEQGGITMCELLDKYEKRGIEKGEQLLAGLMDKLLQDNRLADAKMALKDAEIRKRLYQEYQII